MRGFFKPEDQSRRDCLKWWSWRALIGIVIFWAILILFVPFSSVIINQFEEGSWDFVKQFWSQVLNGNLFLPFRGYQDWLLGFIWDEPRHTTWYSFFGWRLMLIPTFLFLAYEFSLFILNPYYLAPQIFGDGREAIESEVKSFGLLDGKHLMLGLFNGKKMKLPDTRSVFCIGAPGSGKTAGCVIPAILEDKESSLIIHDPKGELARLTSGYRATLGPVFMLNWMGKDDLSKGIRWPSWNPIGGKNLPPLHAGREGYIDTLISFLIPDGPSGTDPYWVKTGRGCLTGMTGYLCGKVEQAKANDYFVSRLKENTFDEEDYVVLTSFYEAMREFPEVKEALKNARERSITLDNYLPIGSWSLIPDSWQGHDACFAMLLDLINNAQIKNNAELSERKKRKDPTALATDSWQMLFEEIVLETAYYGYGRRTLLELNQVLSLPDKQRGSVISMALSGINIFKNSAVRCRTSMNDFNYESLRGMKDPKTGEIKPVTIYMSVPFEDLKSSVLLSSLFINMATQHLMEFGPNEGPDGPYPVSFILDEFQHMPSLQSITDGLVFGRTKQNKFFVCVQDWHQISAKYDQETTDVIMSAAAAKIVKRQNNIETRAPLLKGIETYTKIIHSYSSNRGWFDFSGGLNSKGGISFYHGVSHKIKKVADSTIGGSGILSMAPNKHLLLYAAHLTRPIRAETPLYFKNQEYSKLTGITPAPKLPDYIVREADEIETISQMHVDTSLTSNI